MGFGIFMITVIIPAYNEEAGIKYVLDPLEKSPLIREVIVVDDGSKDKTSQIASRFSKVKVIWHKKNLGKGLALRTGIDNSKGEVLLFLDADLKGIKETHLKNLLEPVFKNKADMVLGVLGKDIRRGTNLASRMAPSISGIRAFKKEYLIGIKLPSGFSVDRKITMLFKKKKLKIIKVELLGVTQLMKEEKYGFKKGFKHRTKMYKEIVLKK